MWFYEPNAERTGKEKHRFPAIGLVTKEEKRKLKTEIETENWGCLLIKKQLNQTFGLINCMSGKVWKKIFHGFYSQKVFTSAC